MGENSVKQLFGNLSNLKVDNNIERLLSKEHIFSQDFAKSLHTDKFVLT